MPNNPFDIKKPRPEAEVFADLAALAASSGFVHALAFLSLRDNVQFFGEELKAEDLYKPRDSELTRTELATLIGLWMKGPVDLAHPGPSDLQKYLDVADRLLNELHRALMQPWFDAMTEAVRKGKTSDPFGLGASLREPIFYGGDAAYDFQYLELALRKYQPDDGWLNSTKGFSTSDLRKVVTHLGEAAPSRIRSTLSAMKKLPRDRWTVLDAFVLDERDVADRADVNINSTRSILAAFSDMTGTKNAQFTSLGDFNMAMSHPIVPISDGRYLLLQRYSLLEAAYESPLYWMFADATYRDQAAKNRGLFTELFTADRLTAVFGSAAVRKNVTLSDNAGTIRGEVDVLVAFGTRALVVQGKSKKLTLAARKGNDLALQADFGAAVQDAYDQCAICCDLLLDPGITASDDKGNVLDIKVRPQKLIPICVVSDHYPALAFQARQFLKHTENDTRTAPLVMDVFLVDVLCEMLESPLQLLSYVERRAEYGDRIMANHELTTLGFHLSNNLWIDEGTDMVALDDGMAAGVDVAMMARRAGVPGRKVPPGILVDQKIAPLGRILNELEHSVDPAKFNLGLLILQMSGHTLKLLRDGIHRIAKQSRIDGKCHDLTLAIGGSGVTVHSTPEHPRAAMPRLYDHVVHRKYASKAKTWFGLLIDPRSLLPVGGNEATWKWEFSAELDAETKNLRRDAPKRVEEASFKQMVAQPGRNDPCWCGSDKKYKRCHLDDDERIGRFRWKGT
jgi:hypothetical protein